MFISIPIRQQYFRVSEAARGRSKVCCSRVFTIEQMSSTPSLNETVSLSRSRDPESLERELQALKRSLKSESAERDTLEREYSDLERKNKQLARKIKDLEADLARESSERDVLDKENANVNRRFRTLELELKNFKVQLADSEEQVLSLKEAKSRLQKKIEEEEREHEREMEGMRNDLRQAKRDVRDKTKRLEEEKSDLERELKRQSAKKLDEKVKTLERENTTLEAKLKLAQSSGSSSGGSGGAVPQSVLDSFLEEKNTLEKAKDRAEEKANSATQKSEELRREKESVEAKYKELEDAMRGMKNRITEEEKKRDQAERGQQLVEEEMVKLKQAHRDELAAAIVNTGGSDLSEKVERLELELQDAAEEREDLVQQISELENRSAELKVTLAELEVDEKILSEERGDLLKKAAEAEEKEKELRELRETFERTQRKTNKEVDALREEIQAMKRAKEEVEYKRQGLERELTQERLSTKGKGEGSDIMSESEKSVRKELQQIRDRLEEERADAKVQIDRNVKKMESDKAALSRKVEEAKEDAVRATKEKASLENQLNELNKAHEEQIGKMREQKEKISALENSLNDTNEELEAQNAEKKKLCDTLEEALRAVEEREKTMRETKVEAEKEKKKNALENTELRSRLEDEGEKRAALKKQIEDLKGRLEESDKASRSRSSNNSEKEENLKTLSEQVNKLTEQAKSTQELIEKAETTRKTLDAELKVISGELQEERETLSKMKSARDAAEAQNKALNEKYEEEKKEREVEKKNRKRIEGELDTMRGQRDEAMKDKSAAEKEKGEMTREVNGLREAKTSLEARKKKDEEAIESITKRAEDESKAREQLENEMKKIQREMKEERDKIEASGSRGTTEYKEENERLKKEISEIKQKSVQAEGQEEKMKTLERKIAETNAQIQAQNAKAEKSKSRKHMFKKQAQDYKTQLDAMQGVQAQIDELQAENARLREAAEKGEKGDDMEEIASVAPRLSTIRRPLGPRAQRNLGVTSSAPTASQAEEKSIDRAIQRKESSSSLKTKAAQMGGVSLFGGITADALSNRKKTSSISESQAASDGKTRMWCVKGRRRIRSFQVKPSYSSLNQGDVFILDVGTRIFQTTEYAQWNGSECNRLERTKGKDIVTRLNRQRGSKAEIITLDQGDDDEAGMHAFYKEVGGKGGDLTSASDGGEDLEAENRIDGQTKLYKAGESSHELVTGGKLSIEMLDTHSAYILDADTEVYLWLGKLSSKELRNAAGRQAEEIKEGRERETFSEVYKVAEGGETVFFCEKFTDWPDGATLGPQKFTSNIAASKKQEKINVEAMYESADTLPALTYLPPKDDVPGSIEVSVVVDAVKEDIGADEYGRFHSENSYIVVHKYGSTDQSYLIYFWQGREGTKNEKGTSAALSMNLAKKLPGASQIRVVQGKEPIDFLRLFKGKYVVLKGKRNSSIPKKFLVSVRAETSADKSAATQVPLRASSLNSGYSYLLRTEDKTFLWKGKQATEASREAAQRVNKFLGGGQAEEVTEVAPGEDFWAAIGGKEEFRTAEKRKKDFTPKFFSFSNASGMLSADRLVVYSQDDLTSDILALVDHYDQVFLWGGAKAREADRKIALETAVEYLKFAIKKDGRPSSEVQMVKEGSEPVGFTSAFFGWDKSLSLGASETASEALSQFSKTYPIEQLRDKDKLPSTVDKSQLEMYLSDAEFMSVFGMTKEAWTKTPGWKKTPKKKELGLF
ncbi:hypothetical protein PROFUN_09315 [Planoprotostelium fungivorum]|uniref:HP domain-containing protein n=1 Tax=Planoprotostelium fungivorum TaxID=1890364 RepID=A0A2P6NHB4_9EUKA|nr:hypothetical protein PROFUN_09315 [Planoprotostelium fungivorum]